MQKPVLSKLFNYSTENINFIFPIIPFLEKFLFFIVISIMASIIIKKYNDGNKKARIHITSLVLLVLTYIILYCLSVFETKLLPLNPGFFISYSYINGVLSLLDPVLFTAILVFILGILISFICNIINCNINEYKIKNKTYHKWNSIVCFFSSFINGIISLFFYLSWAKSYKNIDNNRSSKTKKWFVLGKILYWFNILLCFILLCINYLILR